MNTKPDLGNGISHPARFSDRILDAIKDACEGSTTILDPFAGTGRIHELQKAGFTTVGVELEPEWADMHPDTIVGDATQLPAYWTDKFDAGASSPCYGNRMADHHDARDGSVRRTYRHDLGRALHVNNAGRMQWGDNYRKLHEDAWAEMYRVIRPGGRFVLNIKDHIRKGKRQEVTAWHIQTLTDIGFKMVSMEPVLAPGMRFGSNRDSRTLHEYIIVFDK